jgi:anaerobic selenocysteine-containing dehydrogenase
MAIHSLNALVGNLGIHGGLRASGPLPLARLPAITQDESAKRSLAQPRVDGAGEGDYLFVSDAPQALSARLLAQKPYPLNALLLFATNPFAHHPTGAELAKAVEKIPLVVSFSSFEDETTAMADIVLPDALPMERWVDDYVTHLGGFTCYSVGRPAVAEPRRKSRNAADTLLAISAGIGGEVAKAMPWQSFDKVLRDVAKGLHEVRRGYVVASASEESMRQVLERQGYWVPEFTEFDAFWDALTERGAWADPSSLPLGRTFTYPTPSGKFELYEAALARARQESARRKGPEGALALQPGAADAEIVNAFPLRLCVYRLATQPHGGTRDQPWLQEQPVAHRRANWKSWAEVHPKTAESLGVQDGETVIVESAKGSLQIQVWVTPATRPDLVSMPLFSGIGPNPNDLIGNEVDSFRGFGLLGTTRVRVRRA